MGGNPMQFNVQLKPEDRRVCECGCNVFIPTVALFDVSAIISPNGQAGVVAVDAGLVCMGCGKPADMAPKEEDKPKIQLAGG